MVKSKETGPSLPYSHGQETAREGEGTVTLLSMGASETRRACLNLSGNLHCKGHRCGCHCCSDSTLLNTCQ